jgi:hypothetical protein
VNVEFVVHARVSGRDYERQPFGRKPNVTDKTLVKDRVHSFAIEMTAFGESFQLRSVGLGKSHGHKYATDYHG